MSSVTNQLITQHIQQQATLTIIGDFFGILRKKISYFIDDNRMKITCLSWQNNFEFQNIYDMRNIVKHIMV